MQHRRADVEDRRCESRSGPANQGSMHKVARSASIMQCRGKGAPPARRVGIKTIGAEDIVLGTGSSARVAESIVGLPSLAALKTDCVSRDHELG